MSSHPSERDLEEWAKGAADEHTAHLAGCEQCLDDLEVLTALDPRTERALRLLTRPRDGLIERIDAGLTDRRRRSEDWATFADLFTLGFRTLGLMVDDD